MEPRRYGTNPLAETRAEAEEKVGTKRMDSDIRKKFCKPETY